VSRKSVHSERSAPPPKNITDDGQTKHQIQRSSPIMQCHHLQFLASKSSSNHRSYAKSFVGRIKNIICDASYKDLRFFPRFERDRAAKLTKKSDLIVL
jgi:hypothetical protein